MHILYLVQSTDALVDKEIYSNLLTSNLLTP